MFQTTNQYIYIYIYGLYIMDYKPQILSGARRFRYRAMCHGQLLMAALKAMKFTREAPGDGLVLGMATGGFHTIMVYNM
jgi:hypothetical protein